MDENRYETFVASRGDVTVELCTARDAFLGTIDISNLMKTDLAESGSVNLRKVQSTSFGRLLNFLPTPALVLDSSLDIMFSNDSCRQIAPHADTLLGHPLASLMPEGRRAGIVCSQMERVLSDGKPRVGHVILGPGKGKIWGRLRMRSLRLGDQRGLLVIVEDLTLEKRQLSLTKKYSKQLQQARDELEERVRERTAALTKANEDLRKEMAARMRAQEAVTEAKEQWERTFDAVPDLVAIIDTDHRIVKVNKAMLVALGHGPQELIGSTCHSVFHGMDRPLCECPYTPSVQNGERFVPDTIETNLSGRTYAVSLSPLHDKDGLVTGCVHVARDITRRKRLEEELTFRASRDSLTGLYNRRHFLENLTLACATATRYAHPLSVSVIDVDKFKEINDRYGHLIGDLVLERFGRIIQKELRSSDFAGRFGGDEFIVAFPHSSVSGAAQSVERIRMVLSEHVFRSDAESFHVGASAGVAGYVPQQMDMQDLIQRADVALYEAKALGRNRVLVHQSQTDSEHRSTEPDSPA